MQNEVYFSQVGKDQVVDDCLFSVQPVLVIHILILKLIVSTQGHHEIIDMSNCPDNSAHQSLHSCLWIAYFRHESSAHIMKEEKLNPEPLFHKGKLPLRKAATQFHPFFLHFIHQVLIPAL